jgi:hypothetical protein
VAVGAFGERGRHALGFLHHGPAVAEAHAVYEAGLDVAGLRLRQFGAGLLAEDAFAVEFALVEHHAVERGHVRGGAEQAARGHGVLRPGREIDHQVRAGRQLAVRFAVDLGE